MDGWKYVSNLQRAITERARRISFSGESPSEEWMGDVEVMSGANDMIELHVSRSHKAKYTGKRWNTQSVYVTMTKASWEHLKSAKDKE
jgi:hypothetical protein